MIATSEAAAADGDEASDQLKRAILAAMTGHDGLLVDWLRENSGIEVGQLTLREAGTDKDGRAQWTLELRVEPDKGSSTN